MMNPSERRIAIRVAALIRETLELRGVSYRALPIATATLTRAASPDGANLTLATLVRIADALNVDVCINFRERSPR